MTTQAVLRFSLQLARVAVCRTSISIVVLLCDKLFSAIVIFSKLLSTDSGVTNLV